MLGATVARNFVYLNRKDELRTDDVWSHSHAEKSWEYIKTRYGTIARRFTRTIKYLRLVMGLIYLAMTWLFLAKFISYRREVKRLAQSTDQDSDWSFGQILALAQWIPIVISILSSWRRNTPAPVSEGKVLLHDYEAVDHSDRRGSETSYKSPVRHTTV
ncbi:hypothetical protein KJ359_006852 [Pestalotiopsis sp. 9143b]|nr:hypothetical protein KJ359_006852 [Pestalotiopsis sp. 9143b]